MECQPGKWRQGVLLVVLVMDVMQRPEAERHQVKLAECK